MLTAIIVDDEQKSINSLELLLKANCPGVNIIGSATNALEAVKLILTNKPNLVFLDIQMPGYNGFDILDQIKENKSFIVFITAHKEYAINAIRKGAFDYILKPFDESEIKSCIQRIKETKKDNSIPNSNHHSVIELSVKSGIIYVKQEEIIYLKASGSYTEFHLDNKVKHLVSKNMKTYETHLAPELFFRCHNSYIINLSKVKRYLTVDGLFAEMSDNNMINIARKNKDEFLDRIKHLGH